MNLRLPRLLLVILLAVCLTAAGPMPTDSPAVNTEPCGADPQVTALLALSTQADWIGWIARLSGRDPVLLSGGSTTITTRYSYAMFSGRSNARAYEYVLARLKEWYPLDQIEEDAYVPSAGAVWKNIILTLPGTVHPQESVILSAHLDSIIQSTPGKSPYDLAPGAEDNGSGSAALLEAARIFRTLRFERTVRLIWFTGEEQGLLGSEAYVTDHDLSGLVGVINLDMYGYDNNQDGCFELHIGTLAASAPIGACFQTAAGVYSPALKVDAIDTYNLTYSDHGTFWARGIGAVEVLENHTSGPPSDACGGYAEFSPYYHQTTDTLDKLNPQTGFAITRASLAAAAGLAVPAQACFNQAPTLSLQPGPGRIGLTWTAVQGADEYHVFRSAAANAGESPVCSAEWILLGQTTRTSWNDLNATLGQTYVYRVEAAGAGCVSAPSACQASQSWPVDIYLPRISH